MSGGSAEPESPKDRQCDWCDGYYQDVGNSFNMHQAACPERPDDPGETTDNGSPTNAGAGTGSPEGDPTTDDGPPDLDESAETAPCGCTLDTDELEDGKLYRCKEHRDVYFRWSA